MIVRVIPVHELHGLRGIEVRRLPAEPDIEIDGVAVDVVDVSADHDLCRAVGNLRRSDLCEHFLRWCRWDWLAQRGGGYKERARQRPGLARSNASEISSSSNRFSGGGA